MVKGVEAVVHEHGVSDFLDVQSQREAKVGGVLAVVWLVSVQRDAEERGVRERPLAHPVHAPVREEHGHLRGGNESMRWYGAHVDGKKSEWERRKRRNGG